MKFSRLLRSAACWLFFVTLVYAPWAYGGTTEKAIGVINILLATVLAIWIFELAVSRRRPSVPLGLVVGAALICLLGWCSALNAVGIYDDEFELFAPLPGANRSIPHSVDQIVSVAWMIRGTLLLGCSCFVADLSQRPSWLLRMWYTVAAAGFSIALLGVVQKATGARAALWLHPPWKVNTFFATFYYHANAGAYLNLVFPPIAALARRALAKASRPWQIFVWTGAAVVSGVAIFSNTSRMSQALGAVLVLGLALWIAAGAKRPLTKSSTITAAIVICIIGISVYALAGMSQLNQGAKRWQTLHTSIWTDGRWTAEKVAISSVRDAGAFGFGPGTFRVVFPTYTELKAPEISGGWFFLHQDYLQTLMEWGWLGSVLWGFVFFGGMLAAIISMLRNRSKQWYPRQRLILPALLLGLGSVAIHGLVDFPLQIYSVQLFTASYLGVCWGSWHWKPRLN